MKLNYDDRRIRVLFFISYFIMSLVYLRLVNASSLHVIFQAISVALCGVLLFPLWLYTRDYIQFMENLSARLSADRSGAMYAWAVIIVFLFVTVFLWFITYAVITPLRASVTPLMTEFENHTAYANFALADTFMYNVFLFFLALSTIAVLLWSYHYAQRRGVRGA